MFIPLKMVLIGIDPYPYVFPCLFPIFIAPYHSPKATPGPIGPTLPPSRHRPLRWSRCRAPVCWKWYWFAPPEEPGNMSTTGRNWASLTAWNIGFWWSPFLACSAMNLSNEQLIMRIRTKLFHHLQSCSVESLLEMDCRTLRGLRRGKQGKTEWIHCFF